MPTANEQLAQTALPELLPPPGTESISIPVIPYSRKDRKEAWRRRTAFVNGLQPMEAPDTPIEGIDEPITPLMRLSYSDPARNGEATEVLITAGETDDEFGQPQISEALVIQTTAGKKVLKSRQSIGRKGGFAVKDNGLEILLRQDPEEMTILSIAKSSFNPAVLPKKIECEVSAASGLKRIETRKPGSRHGMRKAGLGAFGVYLALASGGLVDKGLDATSDAKDVVRSEFGEPGEYEPPASIDGIPFSEYPLEAQQEFLQEGEEEHAAYERSVEAVAQTMQDLDKHNYEAIQERSRAFMNSRNDIISPEETDLLLAELAAANTIEEAVQIGNAGLQKIGIGIKIGHQENGSFEPLDVSTSVEDVRRNIREIIDVAGWLPKEFVVNELDSPSFLLQSRESLLQRMAGHNSSGEIAIPVGSHQAEIAIATVSAIDTLIGGGGISQRWVIAHELGHSYKSSVSFPYVQEKDLSRETFEHLVKNALLQTPEHQSTYGITDEGEARAEGFAALFASEPNGLAHPDETRRFQSDANKDVLSLLIGMERTYLGIADYIIAHQSNLMNRSLITVGREG